MKTKEEILNAELATVNMDSAIEITCASLRAMQLYSDKQNKELREAMLNLQSECGYLQKFKDGVDAEIQRLTKEVEELKLKLSGKTFFNPFEQENTRLRELLEKTHTVLDKGKIKFKLAWEGYPNLSKEIDQLLSEINALNHKP